MMATVFFCPFESWEHPVCDPLNWDHGQKDIWEMQFLAEVAQHDLPQGIK